VSDEQQDAVAQGEPATQSELEVHAEAPPQPDPTVQPDPVVQPGEEDEPTPTHFRIRRAPRYRAFGFTGLGIGLIAGVILALSFKATSDYSIQTITGYFAVMFGLVGGLIGLGLAVAIERRRS
jgi:hypothetical protein